MTKYKSDLFYCIMIYVTPYHLKYITVHVRKGRYFKNVFCPAYDYVIIYKFNYCIINLNKWKLVCGKFFY